MGLGATYDVHLGSLESSCMGDFLLVIIELFSLGAFVLLQYTRLTDGQKDGQTESRQEYREYASQSHDKYRFASVSVSVRLAALSRSHFLIDFHQN